MNNKIVLSVKNLNKTYNKNINALKNLNLEVNEGEIFGLLGPNGAGKSTFINILAGITTKTSGDVNVWGFNLDKNPRQVRASLGIVPQEINVDPFFTPRKLLELQAGLYGVKKKDRITDTILKLVSLEDQANSYSRNLSGGMKRRLLIAKAMVHQPPILILDEPTAGVDVELRKNLWDNVKILNQEGVTIILTTHYLFEAQEMCSRIAIINKGSLAALDTTEKLLERVQSKKITFKIDEIKNKEEIKLDGVKFLFQPANLVTVVYDKRSFKFEDLIYLFKKNNMKILDISSDDADLEDVFVQLTKN